MAARHIWHLAYDIPTGLSDAEGWTRKFVVRVAEGSPRAAEVLHGESHLVRQRSRVDAWEIWADGQLVREGTDMRHWVRSRREA